MQPNNPVGPLDIVTISLLLRPADPNVVIRSASLVVERRIELSETTQMPAPGRASACPTPTSSPPPTESEGSSGSTIRGFDHNRESSGAAPAEASTSTAHLQIPRPNNMSQSFTSLASTYTTESASEQRPLIPLQTDLPPKTISLTVAHVDSSGAFQKDDTGTYAKSLTLQWPASKSNSHWAMGETMQTEMIKIRFLAHVKVRVSIFAARITSYQNQILLTAFLIRSLCPLHQPGLRLSSLRKGNYFWLLPMKAKGSLQSQNILMQPRDRSQSRHGAAKHLHRLRLMAWRPRKTRLTLCQVYPQ